MITIAHSVNPFQAAPDSDLAVAQPITFASMRQAWDAATGCSVDLLAVCHEQDHAQVPEGFGATPPLNRSVLDLQPFQTPLALPLIGDIFDRTHQASTADYLIYTNVDIGLQPHFYTRVAALIREGHDALIINRRRLPAHYQGVEELPQILQEAGKSHPGFDCFVFHRDLLPRFALAQVCIGVPFIGITLAQNLFALASNCRVITDEHLTFHLGMELYRRRAPREYVRYNRQQFWRAMQQLGPQLDSRKWPYGERSMPERFWRWGWHPSLPIRLAWQLEARRWRSSGNA
ncbi:MAG: hypothetical protein AAGB22_04785 [Bacteroidota bacterium]